jgi:hypothetical protein
VQVSWVPRLVAPSPKLPLVRVGTAAAGGRSVAVPSVDLPCEHVFLRSLQIQNFHSSVSVGNLSEAGTP